MRTPVRVTANLLQGAVYNPGEVVSLDGPLLYATVLERLGEEFFRSQPSKEELAQATAEPDPDMPLEVHRAGGTWIYAVSAGEPGPHHGTDLTHWNKRIDDGALAMAVQDGMVDMGRSSKVQINSGQYKSYHMPVWTELVDRMVWYALTPDPEQLGHLLRSHVHHLGKGRGTGHGVVTSWEVEVAEDAPEDRWMYRQDGSLTRPVPLSMLPDWSGPTERAPVRPPYWLVQHMETCATKEPDS